MFVTVFFSVQPDTHVTTDDQTDYYSAESNQWLTEKERDALKKREEEVCAVFLSFLCLWNIVSVSCTLYHTN